MHFFLIMNSKAKNSENLVTFTSKRWFNAYYRTNDIYIIVTSIFLFLLSYIPLQFFIGWAVIFYLSLFKWSNNASGVEEGFLP